MAHGRLFTEPQTMMSPSKRIMSLKEPLLKMSKSHTDPRSRILLSDNADDIRSKVKAALTDSIEGVSYDPLKRPGVSNLLSLMAYMERNQRSEEQIAADGRALSMRAFKEEVADVIIKGLADIKAKFDFFDDTTQRRYLREIIALGNEKARLKADNTMTQVRRMAGLGSI
ncbi:MAG: hypothetical protein Q9218_000830 [Villophora microphyllina]